MPILDLIEQRALFRLTRFVAFTIVIFLSIGLAIGATIFTRDLLPSDAGHVSYASISTELHPASRNPSTKTDGVAASVAPSGMASR